MNRRSLLKMILAAPLGAVSLDLGNQILGNQIAKIFRDENRAFIFLTAGSDLKKGAAVFTNDLVTVLPCSGPACEFLGVCSQNVYKGYRAMIQVYGVTDVLVA